MPSPRLVFSLLVMSWIAANVGAKTWITYKGSHEKDLIFPSNIPYDVHAIYLDYNLIETVDRRDLNFTSLVYLNLSHNAIYKLSSETFINVKQLKFLDLSYNKISGSTLTTETFKKLESLELLVLRGNPLGIIKHGVFLPTYFSMFQYAMDFSECSIHTIEPNSLVGLDKLTRLDLSRNNISTLHPDSFMGLYSAKSLNLSHNLLDRVSTRMFHYLNVSEIDLSSNKISMLEDGCFSKNSDIQSLDLSNNRLAIQPKDQFGDRHLSEIDLSQNLFETFDSHLLSRNMRRHLRVLRMADSDKLQRILAGRSKDGQVEGFEKLEKLDLSDNRALTDIEAAAFSSSSKTLWSVHMKNTMLQEIHQDMLNWTNLNSFSVSTNNLKCDCKAKWLLNKTKFNRNNAHLMCAYPAVYRGINLFHIREGLLVCTSHQHLMVFGAIMAFSSLVLLIFVIAYWARRRKACPTCGRRHERHGQYVSVYSKEVDEPTTRIVDDKVNLIDAVDV